MFFMVEMKLYIFARNTTQMMLCLSQCIMSDMSACLVMGDVDLGH